jgi:hypothetical protein
LCNTLKEETFSICLAEELDLTAEWPEVRVPTGSYRIALKVKNLQIGGAELIRDAATMAAAHCMRDLLCPGGRAPRSRGGFRERAPPLREVCV